MNNDLTVSTKMLSQETQIIEMWLANRAQLTQVAYAYEIQSFFEAVGFLPFGQVTTQLVFEYMSKRNYLSPASQARALAAIRSLFSFAVKINYIQFNPAAVLHRPHIDNNLTQKLLTEDEIHRVIQCGGTPKYRALFRLLYSSGARIDELVHLTWDRVIKRPQGAQITVVGKGSKTRSILVPEGVYVEILPFREPWLSQYVFHTRTGKTLSSKAIWCAIKVAARKAGVSSKISAHWFRHNHASHALQNGADLNLIRETLGHTSLATTSLYLHSRPTDSSSMFVKLK